MSAQLDSDDDSGVREEIVKIGVTMPRARPLCSRGILIDQEISVVSRTLGATALSK